jgi:hypothetical protein
MCHDNTKRIDADEVIAAKKCHTRVAARHTSEDSIAIDVLDV